MFAVLANIFNFGVVELFLQKVEFLHEIFFFFFLPWAAGVRTAAAQWSKRKSGTRKEKLGVCVSDVPRCRLCLARQPTSTIPIAVAEIANDSQEPRFFVSSNQTHSDQKWNLAKAKPKGSWGQGGIEVNSSWRTGALFQLTQYVCLTALWFLPVTLYSFAFAFFLSLSTRAMQEEKELVFSQWGTSPPAGVGLRLLTLLHCVLIIYGNSDHFGWGAKWSCSKNLLWGPSSRNSWRTNWITKARLWSLFLQENPGIAHHFLST